MACKQQLYSFSHRQREETAFGPQFLRDAKKKYSTYIPLQVRKCETCLGRSNDKDLHEASARKEYRRSKVLYLTKAPQKLQEIFCWGSSLLLFFFFSVLFFACVLRRLRAQALPGKQAMDDPGTRKSQKPSEAREREDQKTEFQSRQDRGLSSSISSFLFYSK